MTVRSEIITCIPTNTAIPHLSAQLLSGPLSLLTVSSPTPVQQMEPFSYKLLTFPQAIFMDLCFSHNSPKTTIFTRSLSLSYEDFFLPPCPKDTAVSGVKTWLWFGFSKAMSRAGLLFPHSGLLSGVVALTCVRLGLLYPHY